MDLVDNPYAKLEDKPDPLVPTATLQIYQEIEKQLMEGKNERNVYRASAATLCVRRRWYERMGYSRTSLTPRKIINFLYGDLVERTMLHFIKEGCVGDGKLYSEVVFGEPLGEIQFQGRTLGLYKQSTWDFEMLCLGDDNTMQSIRITGHADGIGKRNVDGKWELIEIKSSADYGFDEFKDKGPGDYLKQSHALMLTDKAKALGIDSVRFFYLRKNTGHIWDRQFKYEESLAQQVINEYEQTAQSKIPDAPYGFKQTKLGKSIPWQCGYCSFLDHCKPGYKIEFVRGKPVHIYEEEKCLEKVSEKEARVEGSF